MTDEPRRRQPQAPDKAAGYKASRRTAQGARTRWFRPSDVCVAPDGALLVADWYDPGVGGHATGDKDRPTAPPRPHLPRRAQGLQAAPPQARPVDTLEGQIAALNSPNMATPLPRLHEARRRRRGGRAALEGRLSRTANPRIRARALWLLAAHGRRRRRTVDEALKDTRRRHPHHRPPRRAA